MHSSFLSPSCPPARPVSAIGSLIYANWGSLTPASTWSIAAGEFTGDLCDDVFAYDSATGNLWIAESTGAGFTMSASPWFTVSPASDWQFATGEFSGDSLCDVVAYHPSNGSIWIGINTGSGFVFVRQATVSPAAVWEILAGDFGADGRDDVALYRSDIGEIHVGLNVGGSISTLEHWITLPGSGDWTLATGNFTGDGRDEIAGFRNGVGALHVAVSNGLLFTLNDWQSILAPASAWNIHGGDYDLDGLDDLFSFDPIAGQAYVGRSTGGVFDFSLGPWGPAITPPNVWNFEPGDFEGNGVTEAVGHASNNDTLWTVFPVASPVSGYAWPLSAAPGDTIDFMASGAAEAMVEFLRHSSLDATVDSALMGSTSYIPTNQTTQAEPWKNGAGWATSFSHVIPTDWPSGIYSARLMGLDGNPFQIPFVVKPAPTDPSRVAVLANVNTWLAYNRWDGSSPGSHGKYTGEAEVSFLRPNPNADPTALGFNPSHLARAELWVLSWLEAEGYQPHVFTDIDFHNGEVGPQYEHLVIDTHPEYFTIEMYKRLKEHLGAGGSLLYIGGNGIYEIASYIPGSGQTRMQFLMGEPNGPREPAFFRNQGWDDIPPQATVPERAVLGMATEACVVGGTPYQVLQPNHPIFAGTGVALNDLFGIEGYNTAGGQFNGMASAFEVDTSDGPGALTCPTDCNCGDPFPTPPSSLPPNLSVVARSTGIVPGTEETTFQGEITYYDLQSGGHVLSIGSITAGGSLVIDAVLQQMVRNALGPSGPQVPAMSPLAQGVLAVVLGLSAWAAIGARPRHRSDRGWMGRE